MVGALLDTFTLYKLLTSPDQLLADALAAIAENQTSNTLYVSPITAWELALAAKKPPHKDPPDLGRLTAAQWFRRAVRNSGAKVVPVGQRIACAAALVPDEAGHKDPGDCILIATAKVRGVPIVSRDGKIAQMARVGYLKIIPC